MGEPNKNTSTGFIELAPTVLAEERRMALVQVREGMDGFPKEVDVAGIAAKWLRNMGGEGGYRISGFRRVDSGTIVITESSDDSPYGREITIAPEGENDIMGMFNVTVDCIDDSVGNRIVMTLGYLGNGSGQTVVLPSTEN